MRKPKLALWRGIEAREKSTWPPVVQVFPAEVPGVGVMKSSWRSSPVKPPEDLSPHLIGNTA